ncbi:MAG: hypothetical protein WD768_02505 [Phycisphaeraceae bacterium]
MRRSVSNSLFWAIVVLLALGQPRDACAQAAAPSRSPTRLMKLFHFEEADEGNFEEMPKNWYIIGRSDQTADPSFLRRPLHQELLRRAGFPAYTHVRFDRPQQEKGEHQLYLGLNGGSAGAFLEVGALPAVPESDYVITARVRTSQLNQARGRISAYFVDSEGRRIDASVVDSGLLMTGDKWQIVNLKLSGDFSRAAWIGLQAELLQVQHQGTSLPTGADKHAIQYQDVAGSAWIDDVAVWQVPRIVVRTQSRVNVIAAPDKPTLSMEVRDLTGSRLRADLSVYDHQGNRVAAMQREVGAGDTSIWEWSPPLPRFGWYLVDLILTDPLLPEKERYVSPAARTLRAFLWVPQRTNVYGNVAERFTIDLHGLNLDQLAIVPELMASTGLSSVLMDVWDAKVTEGTIDARLQQMDQVMQPLWKQHVNVVLCLSPVPDQLVDQLSMSANDPLWLFRPDRKDFMPYLAPVLMRYGHHVRRWQLGHPGESAIPSDELLTHGSRAAAVLRDLTPDPRAVMPWSLTHRRVPLKDERGVEFAIDVPQGVQSTRIADFLKEWRTAPEANFTLHLRSAPATEMTQARRVDDLAVRMMHAWEQGPDGLSVSRPWAMMSDPKSLAHPDPLLGVFATVSRMLEGRRVVGRLDLGEGLSAMILDGDRGGLLVAWAQGELKKPVTVKMYLGQGAVANDVWGNRQELVKQDGKQPFNVSSTPIFIEGIDARLALLRASFALTPNLIESSQVTHEHTLTLSNPWTQTLHGEMVIVEPGRDWRIEPRRISVRIEPGAKAQYPIQIGLPVAETSGRKVITARFEFVSMKHPPVELSTPMQLGLEDLFIDAAVSVEKDEKTGRLDAVVTLFITNSGEDKKAMNVFATMPGQKRHERTITLRSGQSMIRHFRFEGAGAKLGDTPVRVGIRDTAGPILLSQIVSAGGDNTSP